MIATIEQAMQRLGLNAMTLNAADKSALDDDGYVMLRGVYGPQTCADLIAAFERRYIPSHLSQPPRSPDSRHALLNDEPAVCRACLAPPLLAAVHHLLRERFFLFDVQGRDPLPGKGFQQMHRDWTEPQGPSPEAIVLAFLEPFGAANGATRVLPRSHKLAGGANAFLDFPVEHPDQVTVAGDAGDVLVMDGYLAHSGTRNSTNGTRRNLQISYCIYGRRDGFVEKRDLTVYRPEERYLLGGEA